MIINIRGTNGSGKSTLVKSFIKPDWPEIPLQGYLTKAGKAKVVTGYFSKELCIVGSYKNACGGMDGIPNFETAFGAIGRAAGCSYNVLCEGILASTVYGSWAKFAADYCNPPAGRNGFAFAYLDTPVELCIERIRQRIAAKGGDPNFNEKLVHDKVKAIAGTRSKAIKDKFAVFDIPHENAEYVLNAILTGYGDNYRAK